MSGRAHVIEIESIVLAGVDRRDPARMGALVEAEVARATGGFDRQASTGIAGSQPGVAGEVARAVVRAVQGGSRDD